MQVADQSNRLEILGGQGGQEEAGGMAFEKQTIQLSLQLLPDDGHPEGRRARCMVMVNGKPLRVSSLRVESLSSLLTSLTGQSSEQVLQRLTSYIQACQTWERRGSQQEVRQQPLSPTVEDAGSSPMPSGEGVRGEAPAGSKTGVVDQHLWSPISPQEPREPGMRGGAGAQQKSDADLLVQQLSLFSN